MAVLSTGLPLADRYLLIEQLGSGGMAVVWRGFDDLLGRPVAVKVLNADIAADPAFREAIYREARSAARLSHPHITHVYDYGEANLPDGETVSYVVMELLDGQTLDDRLADGPLPWPEALRVAAQVADALAAAHRRGIVHRDIAPANVMLTATGAKVLDFGIAALAGGRGDAHGDMMGTPAYVAPERLDDAPAAPSADVYALGATLYEALAGEPPLAARTWSALVEAYRRDPIVAPLSVTGLPAEVVELCARCLARDPARRPGSAEVARILAAAAPTSSAGTAEQAAKPPQTLRLDDAPRTAPVPADGRFIASAPASMVTARLAPEPGRLWVRILLAAGTLVLAGALAVAASGALTEESNGSPGMGGAGSAPTVGISAPPAAGTSPGTNGRGRVGAGQAAQPAHSLAPSPSTATSPATAMGTLNRLLQQINDGQTGGKIRPDVATDLSNTVRNLQRGAIQGGTIDYPTQAAELRRKISQRAQEQGALDPAYAQTLLDTVDQLAQF
ncbi:MAG TPA: protein kinase [Rugosimonospora sp.]|nr:protein kinase [Rugosimonospora sp.]